MRTPVHVRQKEQYREALVGLVVRQTMNGNGVVIVLEDRKLFWINGKAERMAIGSIFVGSIIQEAIDVLGFGKQCNQHGQLETRVVVSVFYIDDSMFSCDSTGRRYVRRAAKRVKGTMTTVSLVTQVNT